jgi:hypothetical protein
MRINSLDDLDRLESKIGQHLRKFKLGDILHSLHSKGEQIEPFIIAELVLFAIRYCSPSKKNIQLKKNIPSKQLTYLCNLVGQYLITDPIIFDKTLQDEFTQSNPIFTFLRIANKQFPFRVYPYSQFSRPISIYYEIPIALNVNQENPKSFDMIQEFQNLNGVSIPEFTNFLFVLLSYLKAYSTFSLDDIVRQARSNGINIPDDKCISIIMSQLAGDQNKLINLYQKRQTKDRRFKMYDISPFFEFPVVYPCTNRGFHDFGNDIISLPIPDLIARRNSLGIYYQLFNNFTTKFSTYFGHVFAKYVETVLKNSITSETLIDIDSELDESYRGKKPDYALIDGNLVILFECKAIKLRKDAKTMATEEEINKSLKEVIDGIQQIDEFIKNCQAKLPNLQRFDKYTIFKPVLITLEEIYLINDYFFRDYINKFLKEKGVSCFDWQILSIGELEELQPHLSQGIHLSQVLQDLEQKTFNDVLEDLSAKTQKTYKDSFLYPKQEELYQRLGIPD